MLDKRESSSKPDRGVVTVETKGFNQRGEEVCYFRRKVHGVEARTPPRPAGGPTATTSGRRLTPGTGRRRFQRAVLAWSDAARRDLPWRRTRDPWAVLVSELMLQQTQVARVMPRYVCVPGPLSRSGGVRRRPAGAVVGAWAGLGYNRRAVNLHRAAAAVVDRHGGRVPATSAELLALPGVGPYTARAVLAFAFERPPAWSTPTRPGCWPGPWPGGGLAGARPRPLADGLVPAGPGWAWNQAMLDLGRHVCTSRPALSGLPAGRRPGAAPGPRPAGPARTRRWGRPARRAASPPSPAPTARAGAGWSTPCAAGRCRSNRVAAAAGWPADPARAARVAAGLVADGLAVEAGDVLRLP